MPHQFIGNPLRPGIDPIAAIGNPLRPVGIGNPLQPPPKRGIISTIGHELLRDVEGGFNLVTAGTGEVLNAIGFATPIGFDDLNQRDIKGALMLGALFGSAGISSLLRGTAAFTAAKASLGASIKGGAALTGAVEAAAGASFGLLRPLDSDDSRLSAIVGDAALFGAFGVGLGAVGGAIKAVLAGRAGRIIRQGEIAQTVKVLTREGQLDAAREIRGTQLTNPFTGAQRNISRNVKTGEVDVVTISKAGDANTIHSSQEFGVELANAVKVGFTEKSVVLGSDKLYPEFLASLDQGTIDHLLTIDSDLSKALGETHLNQYQAIRDISGFAAKGERELGSVAAETLVRGPRETLGAPSIGEAFKTRVLQEVPALRKKGVTDAEVLREGIRAGVVGIRNIEAGFNLDALARELLINDLVPINIGIAAGERNLAFETVTSTSKDGFMLGWISPNTVARFHPEITPWLNSAQAMQRGGDRILQQKTALLEELEFGTSDAKQLLVVKQIDAASERATSITEADAIVLGWAKSTGDEEIINYTTQVTDLLKDYLARHQAAGILEQGYVGYFPMVNANKHRLDVFVEGKRDFAGFFDKRRDAFAELDRLKAINPKTTGDVSLLGRSWPEEALPDLIKRQGPGFTQKRVVNIREFSSKPADALRTYVYSSERKLAFQTLEAETEQMLSLIPDSKHNLRRFIEQMRDDLLGRPRREEMMFDNIMNAMAEKFGSAFDVKPRALKRYSAALRKWESFSRLGGFWSPIINSTQSGNTIVKIGLKDTVAGFRQFMTPQGAAHAKALFKKYELDLGSFVSLSSEGVEQAFGGSIKKSLKRKDFRDAAFRISLWGFNGAEKMNRHVAAWGAFTKKMRELGPGAANEKIAMGFAQEIVDTTQFVYNTANMPQVLRGPVGGLMFQFKSFFIKELEFMGSLSKEEFARFGATMSSIGGAGLIFNIPGLGLLDAASSTFSDQSFSESIKLNEKTQGPAGRVLAYGLPGLISSGIDISDSAGVSSLVEVFDGLFGPSVSDMAAFGEYVAQGAADFGSTGTVLPETQRRLMQTIMPSAFRRALRGKSIYDTGEVRSAYSGKLIYRPNNRLFAAGAQALGAPTVEQTQNFLRDMVVTRVRDRYISARSNFAKEAARAIKDGDAQKSRQIISQAQAEGYTIDQASLNYYVKEIDRDANERRARRTPVQLRERLRATGILDPQLP